MITVPAHRVKQFGVEFFQASFSAKDIDRLVKFEVLGYGGAVPDPGRRGARGRAPAVVIRDSSTAIHKVSRIPSLPTSCG